jgi:predicted TIM-barrel fold metal-dependent hydrolase
LIIDTHVHLGANDLRGDRLVAEADHLGIDRLVVFNDELNDSPDYDDVLAAAAAHPDRLIPFAYLELGTHSPADVESFHAQGFRGFKIIRPKADYNDRSFFPLFEAAEGLGKVLLFHLGVVAVCARDRENDADSARMRPIFLDSICRQFPKLVIWGAHLGNPWYEEAAMLCRWHVNLYFDLTGSSLKAKPPEFFRQLLWWHGNKQYGDRHGRGPWDKILFGTDVRIDLMGDVMNDYRRLMDAVGLAEETRSAIMGGTAAALLGLGA